MQNIAIDFKSYFFSMTIFFTFVATVFVIFVDTITVYGEGYFHN